MPRAGLRNSLVGPPRPTEETLPIIKSRKRTRKILHPIATDTEIRAEVSCSSPAPLTDSACASPARRARLLLNPQLSAAKAALHSHVARQICGREEERRVIRHFCAQKSSNDENGIINNPCLYIYGAPGTGKTAVVTSVTNMFVEENRFKVIFLNCMSTELVRDVLEHILEQLNCKTKLTLKNMWSLAMSHVDKSRLPVLLILDEVDELLTSNDMENVYKLLEWPHQSSNLLMIGIANSLDFTDRLLPRLQLKPEHKPYLLRFSPYNREQMLSIVNDRLGSIELFDRNALMLCASKVASTTGDLRTVFDVCRQSMELATDSPAKANVSVIQMMEVFTTSTQNTNSSDHIQTKSLPTFEKLLLCSLIVCMRANKKRVCTRAKLLMVFHDLCEKHKLPSTDGLEFEGLIDALEAHGLIKIAPSKSKIKQDDQIHGKVEENVLIDALQDQTLLGMVLHN
ncbi:unnamed protein product [Rotaria socialis]|uniref:Cell division control protein n=1 Tax=Rotaria socialis TaxID=392032 RepID=A0A821B8H2_9BILA|nr:unnamed protein product [Rotaria socialis]CAF4588889.1 unnamed protein product [Rotaria socialis]